MREGGGTCAGSEGAIERDCCMSQWSFPRTLGRLPMIYLLMFVLWGGALIVCG